MGELFRMASLYEKGIPPIAGGALDQAEWFVEACASIWSEQAHWKATFGII